MKKLLKSILIATASIGTIAGSVSAVVSCGEKGPDNPQAKTPTELLNEDATKMEAKLRTYTQANPLTFDSKLADGVAPSKAFTSANLISDILQMLSKTPGDYPNTSLRAGDLVATLTGTYANIITTTASDITLNLTLKSKTDNNITKTISSIPVRVNVTFHTINDDITSLTNKILRLIPSTGIPVNAITGTQKDNEYVQIVRFIVLGLNTFIKISDYPSLSDYQFNIDFMAAFKDWPSDPSITPPTDAQETAAKTIIKSKILNITTNGSDLDISTLSPGTYPVIITLKDLLNSLTKNPVTGVEITTKIQLG